jgi:DNA-binding transcriptional LysR family regulator
MGQFEHLGTLAAFVQAAETGSFVAAGRNTGLSASAIGKSIARLEQRLDVRLFHRNTRSMTLTEEGRRFLERCRRIFDEIEAAEAELAQSKTAPAGRLRVSLPLVGMLLVPVIAEFMDAYPAIVLDLDFSDRLVDMVEEGFDLVIRTGAAEDSGLMRRSLGHFTARIVASPDYLERHGVPHLPNDLASHDCLRQRSASTGKLVDWPLVVADDEERVVLSEKISANTIGPLIDLTERGYGIACLPPFAVASQIANGTLISLLEPNVTQTGELAALWPSSRQLSPRVRAFVNFLAERLNLQGSPDGALS